MTKHLILASLVATAAVARAADLFTSSFDGNTGATVLAANTDNTSGSAALGITDWATDSSVTSISGLTVISTGDSGILGGFVQLQGGTAAYANADNVYISRNLNLDTDRSTSRRGFSLAFSIDTPWNLDSLAVRSGHSNNTGNQDQSYSSDLIFSLSGGTLGGPLGGTSTEDYSIAPAFHTVTYDLTGNTIGPGSYALDVYQTSLVGGGAYAIFDGITLAVTPIPEPSLSLLGFFGVLGLLLRRR